MDVGVITNPNSRKNRGRPDRAKALQDIIGEFGEVYETRSTESIKPLLRKFLRGKVRYWVSDGGDGALHWMLRYGLEVLDEDEFSSGDFALPLALPTNGGTIDFVAKNVGVKGNAESILRRLREKLASGGEFETVELETMRVRGIQITEDGEKEFETIGFASAVGGIGQRFFSKYYEVENRGPRDIMRVVAKAGASLLLNKTPLRKAPFLSDEIKNYAPELFKPQKARVTLDGRELPFTDMMGIHVGSVSINLGNVMHFFSPANVPGQLGAIVGNPAPWMMFANLPRMYMGKTMVGAAIEDAPCKELVVEALGDELLAPVVDGEYYDNVKKVTFSVGPKVRIPRVNAKDAN